MKGNIALLRFMGLPVFSNMKELAALIHVEPKLISDIIVHSHKYYSKFFIEKSNGNKRLILQPSKELKAIQAWILRHILDKLNTSPYATAYIKEANISDNVLPHCSNRYFILLDLEEFFPSISSNRVKKVFSLIGYSGRAAGTLSKICTYNNSLPQGAITSPSLSNLIAAKLDRRIAGYTAMRNIIYTRYADDMTLSSNNVFVLCKSLEFILKIIGSEHFKPNMSKLRVLGPRRQCKITGLVKNSSEPKFGIGKKRKRKMRAIMHHYMTGKLHDLKYKNEVSISGWLSYLKSVDADSFSQMNDYWLRLRPKYRLF